MKTTPKLDILLNERRQEYLETVGYASSDERKPMSDPQTIYEFLCDNYNANRRTKECVWLLTLDNQNGLIGSFEISVGTVNVSLVDVREIFKAALISGAVSIVLSHNHPSGKIAPSEEDDLTTRRIIAAGQLLNVPLIDHIIIGQRYYSFHKSKAEYFL